LITTCKKWKANAVVGLFCKKCRRCLDQQQFLLNNAHRS
jgi:hypothetical protein